MENAESSIKSSHPSPSRTIKIVVSMIILVIVVIGGYKIMGNKSSDKAASGSEVGKITSTPTSASEFSSIKDAISKSVSLECKYTDENGTNVIAYIKNGAVRSDYTAKNIAQSGSMILKDNKMYLWKDKEGMMMEFGLSSMMGTGSPPKNATPGQQKPEDVVDAMEKFKDYCKSATVSDELFTVPADVKFTDVAMTKGP